jgi:hypothetical protein
MAKETMKEPLDFGIQSDFRRIWGKTKNIQKTKNIYEI